MLCSLQSVLVNCCQATIVIDLQLSLLFDTDEARIVVGDLFVAEPKRCSISIRQFSPALVLKIRELSSFQSSAIR